jgi:hypothetical protein
MLLGLALNNVPRTATVDGNPVSFHPVDISTADVVLGANLNSAGGYSGAFFVSDHGGTGTPDNIPNASFVDSLNHATRNQHNADGSVTSVECPQILGGDANDDSVLYQKNSDTHTYDDPIINDLLSPNSGWTGLFTGLYNAAVESGAINDNGAIVGAAQLTTNPDGSPAAKDPNTGDFYYHGILLLPIKIRFATPGDPTWSDLAEKQVMLFGDNRGCKNTRRHGTDESGLGRNQEF